MLDRYGAPGFLAAYNAGPARYDKHLADGRPLPVETQDYVAKLAPMIGAQQGDGRNVGTFDLFAWLHAALHDAADHLDGLHERLLVLLREALIDAQTKRLGKRRGRLNRAQAPVDRGRRGREGGLGPAAPPWLGRTAIRRHPNRGRPGGRRGGQPPTVQSTTGLLQGRAPVARG